MVYDARRRVSVLFGGGQYLDDTWEWDGNVWVQRTPANRPPPRNSHGMAYDAARGRVVLFGGNGGTSYLGDTWEWDGVDWTQRPGPGPSGRLGHAMAYDSGRGATVLFGGYNNGFFADTWEWNGVQWALRSSMARPVSRDVHAMAYDSARGRIVLFGGQAVSGGLGGFADDTWEWDGRNWIQRLPARRPEARFGHAMAYDAGRRQVVLVGGSAGASLLYRDTWAWDGNEWSRPVGGSVPPVRESHAMAHDPLRQRTLVFGGKSPYPYWRLEDTWEWDGVAWIERRPVTVPTARWDHGVAYDAVRNRVVMFGGCVVNGAGFYGLTCQPADSTFEWDGTDWYRRQPANRPPARMRHAMVYDLARSSVLLFGGHDGTSPLGDTWEWDGVDWSQRFPTNSPSGRSAHGMAYDAERRRVVLFGGYDSSVTLGDTWEWDGMDWIRITGAGPPARHSHSMAYDPARLRTVVFAGQAFVVPFDDTWEWDGVRWTQRAPLGNPGRSFHHAMVYDLAARNVVLLTGSDTWLYGPRQPAAYETFGTGCAGTVGTPTLAAASGPWGVPRLPWIADAFELRIANLPAAGSAAFVALGLSNTMSGQFPLPMGLAFQGMPGCSLLVSLDFVSFVPAVSGAAHKRYTVANSAALLGFPFYNQAAVFDPGANAAGLVLSNGGMGRIGGR